MFQGEEKGVENNVKNENIHEQTSNKSRMQVETSEIASKTNNVQNRHKSTKKAFLEEREDQNVPELHINDIEPQDIKVC